MFTGETGAFAFAQTIGERLNWEFFKLSKWNSAFISGYSLAVCEQVYRGVGTADYNSGIYHSIDVGRVWRVPLGAPLGERLRPTALPLPRTYGFLTSVKLPFATSALCRVHNLVALPVWARQGRPAEYLAAAVGARESLYDGQFGVEWPRREAAARRPMP